MVEAVDVAGRMPAAGCSSPAGGSGNPLARAYAMASQRLSFRFRSSQALHPMSWPEVPAVNRGFAGPSQESPLGVVQRRHLDPFKAFLLWLRRAAVHAYRLHWISSAVIAHRAICTHRVRRSGRRRVVQHQSFDPSPISPSQRHPTGHSFTAGSVYISTISRIVASASTGSTYGVSRLVLCTSPTSAALQPPPWGRLAILVRLVRLDSHQTLRNPPDKQE